MFDLKFYWLFDDDDDDENMVLDLHGTHPTYNMDESLGCKHL